MKKFINILVQIILFTVLLAVVPILSLIILLSGGVCFILNKTIYKNKLNFMFSNDGIAITNVIFLILIVIFFTIDMKQQSVKIKKQKQIEKEETRKREELWAKENNKKVEILMNDAMSDINNGHFIMAKQKYQNVIKLTDQIDISVKAEKMIFFINLAEDPNFIKNAMVKLLSMEDLKNIEREDIFPTNLFCDYDILNKKIRSNMKQLKNEVIKEKIKEWKQAKIEENFNQLYGYHKNLVKYIELKLLDPSSFEHIDTYYRESGSYLIITMKFKAKSRLNLTINSIVTAKVSWDGELLEVSDF